MKKTTITAMMMVVLLPITLTQAHALPNTVIDTISVNDFPRAVAVNEFINRVYVANGGSSHTITVINTLNDANTIIGTIPVGHDPSAIAVNESTNRIYVTNFNSHTVTVINTLNDANTIIGTIPVDLFPSCVAVNKSTNRVYVGSSGSHAHDPQGTVTVINTLNDANTIISTIPVGNLSEGVSGNFPEGIAVNETTNRVYVTIDTQPIGVQPAAVTVINTLNDVNTVIGTIPVGINPRGIAVNESTNRLYVAILFGDNVTGSNVTVIDTLNDANTVIDTIPTGFDSDPLSVAVNKFSKRVYVVNLSSDTIALINTDTNLIIDTIPVGSEPNDIAVNISKNRAYVVNRNSDTVSVIETEAKYRFVVMADSRGNSTNNQVNQMVFKSILRSVNSLNPPASLILFGGDMINGASTVSSVESALIQWKGVVNQEMGTNYAETRILPAFGTHEKSGGLGTPERFQAFSNVFNPVASFIPGSPREYMNMNVYKNTVYYCDYSNARFFVLNNDSDPNNTTSCTTVGGTPTVCPTPGIGHEVGQNQRNWIAGRLGANDLNFFIHHEPVYYVNAGRQLPNNIPGSMDAKPSPRSDYLSVIQQNDTATLVFSAHEHQYARMKINESKGLYEMKTATCGAPIYNDDGGFNSTRRAFGPKYAYHYAIVDVDGKQVTVNVNALPSLPPGGLPDNGSAYTVNISPPIQAKSVMFFIDNSVVANNNTGLAEIRIINSSGTDITETATRTRSAETVRSSSFATDNNPNTSWITVFDRANTWIKLEWATSQSISIIRLNDVPVTDTAIHVTGGTLIIEDANRIPIVGTIVNSNTTTATLNVNQIIDPFTHNYSTHSEVPPPSIDEDQDGILNTAEGSGDVDGDGIPDFQDGDTGVALLASDVGQVAIDVNENQIPGIALNAVDTILDTDSSLDQQTKPNLAFPFGLIGMDITGISNGETVPVTLTFPSNIPMDYEYWKYDAIRGWYNLNALNRVGDNDGDNILTITLTDGGIGDGDGVADGTIRDPGGLGAPKPEIVNGLVTFNPIKSSYKTITDTTGCILDEADETNVYVGQFSFDATLRNKSNSAFSLSGLVVEVTELTNNNLLQNADGVPGGVGARLTVPNIGDYADGVLGPGESVKVHFVICLTEIMPFRFFVDVLGLKKAISAQALAAPESTSAEPGRAKLHRRGFFGRFRPQ